MNAPSDCYPTPEETDAWCEDVLRRAQSLNVKVTFLEEPVYDFRLGVRHTGGVYLSCRSEGDGELYCFWQPCASAKGPVLFHLPGYGSVRCQPMWEKVTSNPPSLLLERVLRRAKRSPLDVGSKHSARWRQFVCSVLWQAHFSGSTDVVLAQSALAEVHGTGQHIMSTWIRWGREEFGWEQVVKPSYGKRKQAPVYRVDVSDWPEIKARKPRSSAQAEDGHTSAAEPEEWEREMEREGHDEDFGPDWLPENNIL